MPERKITITGIVIPAAWDETGQVTSVALSTADEKEYILKDAGAGLNLSTMIRQEIEVRGALREEEGTRVIAARKIRLKTAWDTSGRKLKKKPQQK
ncbi:MAG: hypothetical protein A2521_14410 [Deltaproteobacteria bacterium RIFOXYD12_FULL_57_12]|nr:MAG: hypothetical protein A2521_14410 [Deltaproteobacteria bacterium RIFOXYD12_FULL_57_12]